VRLYWYSEAHHAPAYRNTSTLKLADFRESLTLRTLAGLNLEVEVPLPPGGGFAPSCSYYRSVTAVVLKSVTAIIEVVCNGYNRSVTAITIFVVASVGPARSSQIVTDRTRTQSPSLFKLAHNGHGFGVSAARPPLEGHIWGCLKKSTYSRYNCPCHSQYRSQHPVDRSGSGGSMCGTCGGAVVEGPNRPLEWHRASEACMAGWMAGMAAISCFQICAGSAEYSFC
jgi:hypothetical protein